MFKSKNLVIGALVILTLIVLGLNYYFLRTPPVQDLPKPSVPAVQPDLRLKYSFQGELPVFKDTYEIYQTKPFVVSLEAAAELGRQLGFSGQPEVLDTITGKHFNFFTEQKSLIIESQPALLKFYSSYQSNERTLSNAESAIQAAQRYLDSLKLIESPFEITLSSTESLLENPQTASLSVVPFTQANRYPVYFHITINSHPILTSNHQVNRVMVVLDSTGAVVQANIPLPSLQLQPLGRSALAPPEQALSALNIGEGTIYQLNAPRKGSEDYLNITNSDVSFAQLEQLDVIYYLDPTIAQLQPYYRFSGTAQTTKGETIEVEVLITALPQEVFKK